jgi:hypothetical protein
VAAVLPLVLQKLGGQFDRLQDLATASAEVGLQDASSLKRRSTTGRRLSHALLLLVQRGHSAASAPPARCCCC